MCIQQGYDDDVCEPQQLLNSPRILTGGGGRDDANSRALYFVALVHHIYVIYTSYMYVYGGESHITHNMCTVHAIFSMPHSLTHEKLTVLTCARNIKYKNTHTCKLRCRSGSHGWRVQNNAHVYIKL